MYSDKPKIWQGAYARLRHVAHRMWCSSRTGSVGNVSTSKIPNCTREQQHDVLANAVILNSNDDHLNEDCLNLLLKTIFGANWTSLKEILSRLRPTFFTCQTIRQAEDELQKFVLDSLSTSEVFAHSVAAQFFEHRSRSDANSSAYATSGKPYPNGVFWPNPCAGEHARSLRDERPFVRRQPIIGKNTAISSIGSCFAIEIAHALQKSGLNYVVKEPNTAADGTYWFKDGHEKFASSSAAWGILFNCPSFLQLVQKAFGHRRPAKILWTQERDGIVRFYDPFREEIEFPSVEAFEKNYEKHILAARAAFIEAEVLVITLGLNEVWYFRPDGSAFSRSPWRTAPSLVEHRVLTVEENVRCLQEMLDILRTHNPEIGFIVTLSPIPLHATFLGEDSHVIEANSHSKAVLRVAAEEFVRANEGVYYFPSYELITNCLANPWEADERHVSSQAVASVMEMFKEMYCV
jgi:hypothetical protein